MGELYHNRLSGVPSALHGIPSLDEPDDEKEHDEACCDGKARLAESGLRVLGTAGGVGLKG